MFTRRGRYVACAAAVALALGGAGAAVTWHESAGKTHAGTVSAYCGLVACAVLNSGGTATATPATPATSATPLDSVPVTGQPSGGGQVRVRTSPTPAASSSSPVPVTVPTVTPTPTPVPVAGPSPTPTTAPSPTSPPGPSPTPASPDVTASYSVLRYWHGGFLAGLTIVNQGGPAVTGWQ